MGIPSIGYAVDLSHWQSPKHVPWEAMVGKVDFVICRAAYGSALVDDFVRDHVASAREVLGVPVGLYLFFRPVHEVGAQLATLERVADEVGLRDDDLVPALDIEDDPHSAKVNPSWSGPTEELVERMAEKWGNALVYQSQWEWIQMGSPAWVLSRPLWVPNYTAAPAPRSPGGVVPTLWQHRVGEFDPSGPGGYYEAPEGKIQLDQSRVLRPVPRIRNPEPALSPDDEARIQGLIQLTLAESAKDADDSGLSGRLRYS